MSTVCDLVQFNCYVFPLCYKIQTTNELGTLGMLNLYCLEKLSRDCKSLICKVSNTVTVVQNYVTGIQLFLFFSGNTCRKDISVWKGSTTKGLQWSNLSLAV